LQNDIIATKKDFARLGEKSCVLLSAIRSKWLAACDRGKNGIAAAPPQP
jgi:hypothetical protein